MAWRSKLLGARTWNLVVVLVVGQTAGHQEGGSSTGYLFVFTSVHLNVFSSLGIYHTCDKILLAPNIFLHGYLNGSICYSHVCGKNIKMKWNLKRPCGKDI